FGARTDKESTTSATEWQKHLSSAAGFSFPPVAKRDRPYDLTYSATCDDPQVEQGVRGYLDWVDDELRECGRELGRFRGRWQDLALPQKVVRNIKSDGYESGTYRLALDQDKVLDLLVGNNLYADQSVFVRELIQNAIDAVRTRQELDKNPPRRWTPGIRIRTWTDEEGYHWFRIEDNGVGMTRQTILNHLLKVGSSYYASDAFQREKIRQQASADYTPISRFGIGILSCFMDGNGSAQVEISTKHYDAGTPLRLRVDGTSGFYRLCNHSSGHRPGPMRGVTREERREYLTRPGTVIAVRTNLYASGAYGGFKEIVDKYVAFPPVPIHYEGVEGSFDYPTEQQLVAGACGVGPGVARRGNGGSFGINPDTAYGEDSSKARRANGGAYGTGPVGAERGSSVVDLPIPVGAVEQIQRVWPEFSWPQGFKVQLGRLSLGAYAESEHVSGAAVVARTVGDFPTFAHRFGTHEVEMRARAYLEPMTP
ncbi:MAG: ATP-binding protein, partial [Atopobiaceae bacterium]|nr:ATP-binding protein [Atopobiaceae bacterium]